jgi:proteasome lid subunit RPN8/RPN11
MSLHLTNEQAEEMIRHAREEYPNEACGLLAGKDGRVEKIYRMTNAEHSPVTYRLDPEEQYRAMMDMEERGWDIVAIYHSHVASPAYPSATDVRMAYYPDSFYVIISLADRGRPEIRAFRIVDERVEEAELVVSGG